MRNKKPKKDEKHRRNPPDSESYWWLLTTLLMAIMTGLAMMSCDSDASRLSPETEEGLPATIRLNVVPDAATQAQTRASEGGIRDLHVLVYNSRGELIGRNYSTSSTLTVGTRSGSGYTLYAIANTGDANLFNGGVASTETQLKAMKTPGLIAWDGLTTASHLVMAGSRNGVTISAGSSALQGGMTVARIAAKATLNITTKAGSGITIKDYQVFSLPEQSYYVPSTADAATAWIDGTQTAVNATSVSKVFFMYENRKGIVSDITAQKDKGEVKAPLNSTYVVINGEANGYKATWRVYLGENNTSDFNIKRNSWYTYNITLSRPGTDGADTRVEVEEIFRSVVGGNANCYMVKPGDAVAIPVERANESVIQLTGSNLFEGTYHQLQVSSTWTATLVWESSIGLVTLSETTGTGPTGHLK